MSLNLTHFQNMQKNIQQNHELSDELSLFIEQEDIYYLQELKNVRMTMPWIIISLGIIGNLFILMIFLKKSKRATSNGFCFNALAISDTAALIFMLLSSLLNLKVVAHRTISCKLIKYFYFISLQASSWSLVVLSLDRVIAVCFVFKYHTWCKKRLAPKLLLFIFAIILCANLHLLVFVEADVYQVITDIVDDLINELSKVKTATSSPSPIPSQSVYSCRVDPNKYSFYFRFIYSYWDIYHAIIYGILPFLIILTCNVMIILKLTKLNKKKFRKTSRNPIKNKRVDIDPIKSTQVTVMLLSVAFVFLVLTSPVSIYMAFFYDNLKSVRLSRRLLIRSILRYIGYFNNAVNFYVYFLLSSEFRKEFIKAVKTMFKVGPNQLSLCTRSTEMGSVNMLSTPQKPQKNYEDSSITNQPFLSQSASEDAVELYKKNTRNANLYHYKQSDTSLDAQKKLIEQQIVPDIDPKPFISDYATLV